METAQGYNPDFDIRGGRNGEFSADYKFGDAGERHVYEFLEHLNRRDGKIEVKTDGYDNLNLFVEVAHCPNRETDDKGRLRFSKSGLLKTQSDYYIYTKANKSGALKGFLMIPTQTLRDFYAEFVQRNNVVDVESLWGAIEKGKSSGGTCYKVQNLQSSNVPSLGLRIHASDLERLFGDARPFWRDDFWSQF